MGKFIYGATSVDVAIDDRTLAHLRVAITTKLRRNESFMFDVEVGGGHGRRSFWIHPAVPIQFHFATPTTNLNRAWIEQMILIASGASGLEIPPEPGADDRAA
ncbi:MAG TPA: ATP-dependent DNA ligase [Microbacteriaceae bacterium]|nr:ATP-dependent DNA ligase [Microbacteriaceae bacterium]